MAEAGGDVLRFVLDEAAPDVTVENLLVHLFAGDDTECSHRHCTVAEWDGCLVGLVNAFPTDLLQPLCPQSLSARERHLQPRTDLNDAGSYRLNMIAVDPNLRRAGVGSALIEHTIAAARDGGFERMSLHVWADNKRALAFYRAQGFRMQARADVPFHPALPHQGGSLLMVRRIERGANTTGDTER